ncbi:MAG TPA: sigma-54 dependent transcriptional regulator [Candidatus Hydrogenedentes bacterium]|nr:sigma-54 dependent transcriptional regulator [Candidatus Hydrogenedentota bacterium]HPG68506.1 sigma-54 dependent transcriptional regulator [Candidatus Hydrogenedentota bacterium]
MIAKQRVLVVDDEINMRELLEIILDTDGYEVVSVPDVPSAIEACNATVFDAVLTDLRIGNEKEAGMELLTWLSENAPTTPAIMMTAHGSVETAIEAMKRGADDYVMKPFKNDEIRLLIRRSIQQRNILRENVALRRDQVARGKITNIIGNSHAIEEVKTMIRRVAMLPSTIAIHGESGVGKEVVARAIHTLSARADKPFVAINCGGIPEHLLESELFGHKRGSFTGAVDDKEGLFVVAHGGSLFLDEIGEMPLSLQVRLLRVLDNNSVMPVGGTSQIKVDVRIVSATNRDLEKMVADGTFRKDLFYRLNVIPVYVPPLRDRADDIPLLARHFIEKHASKMGRQRLGISKAAMAALQRFAWPGNVRELENVMERAVALCSSEEINVDDLPQNVRNFMAEPAECMVELPPGGLDLEARMDKIESAMIGQALERSKHSQKRAAQLLGLTPRSLRYRLKKHGLETDASDEDE